jgi:hypothetical protein
MDSQSKQIIFRKRGVEIASALRERRYTGFQSEYKLFVAWNNLWKGSMIKKEPNIPVILNITSEQMKWIPGVYIACNQLLDDLLKTPLKGDIFGYQGKRNKNFATTLKIYSDLLKEFLFTDDKELKKFLFSDDLKKNGGKNIILTRLKFNEILEHRSEE